ncbi:MAG TPA: uroporphyrinogen decarboxylase family protein [Phycisphaerae bacterium]|nr:uroporphyrinogen decarboxylase family protein [Phycisphaerae bacterium]
MTDRRRFINQMHHRPVDRCFNMEFGYWNENFRKWDIFRDHNITTNPEADLFFNFDRIEVLAGDVWLCPAFEERIVEDRGATRIIQNREGLLAEVPTDGHDTIPRFTSSPVVAPDDWKRVKDTMLRRFDPARRADIDALRRLHPPDRDYPLGVYCGSMIGRIRNLLTFEGLAYACRDYPDMVEDMVETCCLLVEDDLDQVLGRIDFDFAAGWEDICFRSGPLVTLDFFRQVVVPRYRRIASRLHMHGIDIWYTDCDGDIRHILPLMLEAGLNCLFPCEVHCSGHPGELLDRYGPDLRIMGGVDKMALLKGREEIRAYLESVAPWVESGGFIPFCDHRCPPDVAPADYLYYLDLKERMFGRR